MKIRPPHSALKFLRWFCREDYIEEIEGDLTEVFERQIRQSPGKAKRNFLWSVIKYFRPEFLKSFRSGNPVNPFIMVRHNFLITWRNFLRYKSSFLINLIGLSTGLACALLIYLWVNDELSIDKIHKKDSQLYQVMKTSPNAEGGIDTYEYTPGLLAQSLDEEIPEVEYAVSVIRRKSMGIISAGDKRIKAMPQFADKDYFHVFSGLIHGEKENVLSDMFGVLLSDKLALKLFNTTENVIGKMIEWDQGDHLTGTYMVSGIFEAPPANATAQFDIIFNYLLFYKGNMKDMALWYSNNPYTFVILKHGTDLRQFNEKIRDFTKSKIKALYGESQLRWEGDIFLQRYSFRYLYNRYENGVQSGGRIVYVKLFSIIAVFILVIACINFMNLSTAQAARRMKEIGIKKAIGVNRKTLLFQHLSESVCMAFVALAMALVLITLLLPSFNAITGKQLSLNFDTRLILAVAVITMITGLISGSYPAFYLSGFRPVTVLNGKLNTPTSWGEAWIRRGLVVFQFTISVVLIVSVLVVYRQIEFIQSKNLGYNKDNVIVFTNEGKLRNHAEVFITEVKRIPGVVNASSMGGDLIGEHGGGGGVDWEGKLPGEGIEFSAVYADYNLIEMLNLEMVQGRTFSRDFGSDTSNVIFNETAIAAMRLKDPVGKTVTMWGKENKIIGIVKDFHFESLYENVKPFFFRFTEYKEANKNMLIKLKAGMEKETLEKIQKFYLLFNEGLPFEYKFLDDDYQKLYASEQRVAMLSRYFAGIAILISCLGLFGLATFTAERKRKEIGIRKILGSGEFGIIRLLSRDFTGMVLISIIIALPASYLIAKYWLEGFAYRIDLEWWFFMGAGFTALLIAWLTVGVQTIRAARINPVECLRNE